MLLGQVDMEKWFTDLDEQEQRDRLNEDMEPELKYAFDMEDETADSLEEDTGIPESFVIGEAGTVEPQAAVQKPPVPGKTGKPENMQDAGKQIGMERQTILFPTVCSTGNLPWSRKSNY